MIILTRWYISYFTAIMSIYLSLESWFPWLLITTQNSNLYLVVSKFYNCRSIISFLCFHVKILVHVWFWFFFICFARKHEHHLYSMSILENTVILLGLLILILFKNGYRGASSAKTKRYFCSYTGYFCRLFIMFLFYDLFIVEDVSDIITALILTPSLSKFVSSFGNRAQTWKSIYRFYINPSYFKALPYQNKRIVQSLFLLNYSVYWTEELDTKAPQHPIY